MSSIQVALHCGWDHSSIKLALLIKKNKNIFYTSLEKNTGSTREDPYWTSRKNSLELIELSCSI
jgi:hypothetical protein